MKVFDGITDMNRIDNKFVQDLEPELLSPAFYFQYLNAKWQDLTRRIIMALLSSVYKNQEVRRL